LISAAAPLGSGLEHAIQERLGMQVKQGYGMTELSPVANYCHDDDFKAVSALFLIAH